MPKMKTQKSARKRFKVTATGRIRRKHAFHSHLLLHKRPARKRRLRQHDWVSEGEAPRIQRMLPYRQHLS